MNKIRLELKLRQLEKDNSALREEIEGIARYVSGYKNNIVDRADAKYILDQILKYIAPSLYL